MRMPVDVMAVEFIAIHPVSGEEVDHIYASQYYQKYSLFACVVASARSMVELRSSGGGMTRLRSRHHVTDSAPILPKLRGSSYTLHAAISSYMGM